MGVYLNGTSAYGLFQEDYSMTYYIDKTKILSELIPMKGLKNHEYKKDLLDSWEF